MDKIKGLLTFLLCFFWAIFLIAIAQDKRADTIKIIYKKSPTAITEKTAPTPKRISRIPYDPSMGIYLPEALSTNKLETW